MGHLAVEDNFQSIKTAKARSGYRVQSLRKGRDRQCRDYSIRLAHIRSGHNCTLAQHRQKIQRTCAANYPHRDEVCRFLRKCWVFRFLAKQHISLPTARTSTTFTLLHTFIGIAVEPQVAIGIAPGNSKPARSEESCRGQCQRRHLHPTARSRSILHPRLRRAPEQLPTR